MFTKEIKKKIFLDNRVIRFSGSEVFDIAAKEEFFKEAKSGNMILFYESSNIVSFKIIIDFLSFKKFGSGENLLLLFFYWRNLKKCSRTMKIAIQK